MTAKHEVKDVQVYDKNGRPLAPCSKLRAKQMIARGKAIRIGPDMVQLLHDKDDLRRFKQQVMIRDKFICYVEEITLQPEEATVDHVRSRAKGGSDFPENLACCSIKHNQLKGCMDLEDYIKFLIHDTDTDEKLRTRLMERFPQWITKGEVS